MAALLAGTVAAHADEPAQLSDAHQIREDLHDLYVLMTNQLDLMAAQQRQVLELQIELWRMAAACGRKAATPPVYAQEH